MPDREALRLITSLADHFSRHGFPRTAIALTAGALALARQIAGGV